jgi:hypothetical protein
MAKDQKNLASPTKKNHDITAPKALVPIMQAFHVDSDEAAKSLIQDAAKAIYKKDPFDFGNSHISKEEINGVISLMKGISPRDAIETLYAAQIVVCHMIGIRKLAESFIDEQKLGLNFLRFSNEAMQNLEKKCGGGHQNITVNYNYSEQGNALMQNVTPIKGEK